MVKLYRYLCAQKKEFVLSKQIVRSGTAIGANVEEAIGGQSKKDFLSKMGIAYKEALMENCEELLKLSGSIIRTTKPTIPNS